MHTYILTRSRYLSEDSDSESDDEESEDEEVSEESEASDETESGTEDREVYDVDICPAGCSIVLYNRMCSEREKRVDIEEVIASERASRDSLLKELETAMKRAKVVIDLVEQAQEELEEFQVYGSTPWFSYIAGGRARTVNSLETENSSQANVKNSCFLRLPGHFNPSLHWGLPFAKTPVLRPPPLCTIPGSAQMFVICIFI